MRVEEIKINQLIELEEQCLINGVNFDSMKKLLNSEKNKKLQKRNHYIQLTINSEIEKSLDHETSHE
jgi:hypothetical protein